MDLKADLKSVKTTVLGIVSGLVMILTQVLYVLDSDPETTGSMSLIVTGLGMLGVGVFAKDGDKSSEDVGVKK